MFPTGLVLGVYNRHTRQTTLNPPVAQRVARGDMLVMMRPTAVAPEDYAPIREPVPIDLGAFLPPPPLPRAYFADPELCTAVVDEYKSHLS